MTTLLELAGRMGMIAWSTATASSTIAVSESPGCRQKLGACAETAIQDFLRLLESNLIQVQDTQISARIRYDTTMGFEHLFPQLQCSQEHGQCLLDAVLYLKEDGDIIRAASHLSMSLIECFITAATLGDTATGLQRTHFDRSTWPNFLVCRIVHHAWVSLIQRRLLQSQ